MSDFRTLEMLQEIKDLIIGKPKEDNFMDINMASKYTNLSASTLRRAVKNNELEASTKLGKLLFKRSSQESWLNG